MWSKLTQPFCLILIILQCVDICNADSSSNSPLQDKTNNSGKMFCGQRFAPIGKRIRRVIGGTRASPHVWPWQVMIRNGTEIYCGGSIISERWILTAGHCLDKKYNINIHVGRRDVNDSDIHEQKLEMESFIIHPKFRRGTNETPGDYDMALIKLKTPILPSRFVQPVCLPDANTRFPPGHECYLTGWGVTNTTTAKTATRLREVKIPLVADEVCNSNESYGGVIGPRYFCAGQKQGGKDACFKDSGGPLVCSHTGYTWYLTGMVEWGIGCAKPNKYGVYINITKLMSFIRQNVTDLPIPYTSSPGISSTTSDVGSNSTSKTTESKERLFVAIICALSVIIAVLLATLCIIHFYGRRSMCCSATEKVFQQQMHTKSPKLLEANGKAKQEVSV